MEEWNLNCVKCGKFILTEGKKQFAGDIKCVAGSYENGYYDVKKDVFYCKECAQKRRLLEDVMNYKKLLETKGFSLNSYPEGNFWELEVKEDEELKRRICKVFQADIELFDGGVDIDTLILQCAEDFTKCIFYYDCNTWDMETEEFINCIKRI